MVNGVLDRSVEEILQARFGVQRSSIVALCERFQIVEMGVFGSALRNDFREKGDDPSDVDLLIVFENGYVRSLQTYLDLREAAEQLFERTVDICQKDLIDNPYRRAKILRSTQVIYAAE